MMIGTVGWNGPTLIMFVALVVIAVLFWLWGASYEREQNVKKAQARMLFAPNNDRPAKVDSFVMLVGVGVGGSAVIVDVKLSESDPREFREIEFDSDRCEKSGVKGVPMMPGLWECVVDECVTNCGMSREFLITESRKLF